jgi:glucose-6-phosphate isomerase
VELVSSVKPISSRDTSRARDSVSKILGQSNSLLESLFEQMDQATIVLKPLDAMKAKYKIFAVVGIGGSSLGIQVMTQYFSKDHFTFFDNVDAAEFESQIKKIGPLANVGWLFISKSGETIETLATLEFIDQIYAEEKLDLALQSIVITEKKTSALSDWAHSRKVNQFEIPLAVGGRYSALSNVGLVPAYLMGLDIKALASGARRALESQESISSFVAEILSSFERQEWITVLWSYSSRLKNFGLWWQQLWAESLAKKLDLEKKPAPRVSTPMPLIGATDQHSVLQQVYDGYRDKFVLFLRVSQAEAGTLTLKKAQSEPTQVLRGRTLGDLLQAEAIATQQSLTEVGVSNLTLQIDQFNEESLGFLVMFMQISVLALGKALNLNPLNQPGVEHGKVLCKKILNETQM